MNGQRPITWYRMVYTTGISRQGRSISYNIRQVDELQHYSNETSTAFQQTKVHKYKHQMD